VAAIRFYLRDALLLCQQKWTSSPRASPTTRHSSITLLVGGHATSGRARHFSTTTRYLRSTHLSRFEYQRAWTTTRATPTITVKFTAPSTGPRIGPLPKRGFLTDSEAPDDTPQRRRLTLATPTIASSPTCLLMTRLRPGLLPAIAVPLQSKMISSVQPNTSLL